MLFVSATSSAKELRYKELPLDLRAGDRLVVQGLRAQVRLAPAAPGKGAVLKARKFVGDKSTAETLARFEALSFNIRRDGSTVRIDTTGPDSKSTLAEWLKGPSPELVLEFEMPPVPVDVSVRDGSVTAQGWTQPLAVSLVDGQLKATQTEGALKLQMQRGEARIQGHRGPLEIDSYGAKVFLSKVEGDVKLTNFGGDSSLAELKGNIDVRTQSGGTTVNQSSGSLDFALGRGPLNVTAFEGPLRGETETAAVSAAIEGEAEVSIQSNQGSVSVKLPAGSGAAVRLQSDEGSVSTPDAIKPSTTSAGLKVASGRLAGSGPRGSVNVKSKTGAVRLR